MHALGCPFGFSLFAELQCSNLKIAEGEGDLAVADGELAELVFHEVAKVCAAIIGRGGYRDGGFAIVGIVEANDEPVIGLGLLDGGDDGVGDVGRHEGKAGGQSTLLCADLRFIERLIEDIAFLDYAATAKIVKMGHE